MNGPTIALLSLLLALPSFAQHAEDSMKDCPMHAEHRTIVESHGDEAMGFPHDKTTHHFRITANGGAIEVNANDPADKTNTDAIRSHLKQITQRFGDGDFSTPMFVHDGIPPGTTTMKLLKRAIRYTYEETPAGGRVRMQTDDPVAVAAIHDFLRFQVLEHHTGDSVASQ